MLPKDSNGTVFKWIAGISTSIVVSVGTGIVYVLLTATLSLENRVTAHDEAFKYIKESLARIESQQKS